jgi:hypothetical protein
MSRSVVGYLTVGGVVALLVNVAINAGIGWAIYAGLEHVPLIADTAGAPDIRGDTLIGAFLIAFFTILIVAPATRREVRAGKVSGVGPARPWRLPRWIERRPLRCALLAGCASALIVGGGTLAVVTATGIDAMSVAGFLWFKVGFAGMWGGLAAVLVGALAIAGEDEPALDDRWCRNPQPADLAYPCDYVDKGGLAVTSQPHGCSGTPTWQLVLRGVPDPLAVRATLGDLLLRYPSLTTRVQSLDALPAYATRFRYAAAPTDARDLFELVDTRERPDIDVAATVRAAWNRHLDQFREAPISLTMVVTSADDCRLLFRQHHGIADGRAFIELLGDFADFLALRSCGSAPSPDQLAPIHRRGELEPLGLGRAERAWFTIAGFGSLTRSIWRALVRPVATLAQNQSNDYTGTNGAIRWVIDDDAIGAWRPAHDQMGASLNSLLAGAWFLANQRWHRALGRRLGRVNASMVMETRPRDGTFRSFANHLATLEVELPLERDLDPPDAVRSIHAQVARQRRRGRPIKRLLCERALVARMPLDKLQQLVFESKRPAYNLNLSNLIPLEFPVMAGDGWRVEEVLITTPVTPRGGIALTVIRYGGRICFNFNYAASAITATQTAELAAHFREVLQAMTGYRACEPATAALDAL